MTHGSSRRARKVEAKADLTSLSFLAMKIIFGVCAGGTRFSVGRLYYLTGVQRVGAYWWMWKRSARVDWASVISVIMRRAVGRPLVPSW